VFDTELRSLKDRALAPLVRALEPVSPTALTVGALAVGLGCAGAAALGWPLVALGLWVVNRVLDGLDGLVARRFGKTSDRGGYLDLVFDFVVYAAVPLGLAWAAAVPGVWAACAFLLGAYYVNAVSWLALSALEEKRRTAATAERQTSLAIPRGLMEGFETVVLYLAFFLWTPGLGWLFAAGAVLVLASAAQRVVWALRRGL
jgi:phosphatidylglycerophosphate synthase